MLGPGWRKTPSLSSVNSLQGSLYPGKNKALPGPGVGRDGRAPVRLMSPLAHETPVAIHINGQSGNGDVELERETRI